MRPRGKDKHLPPCVYHKHGAYFYVKRGIWKPLGSTLTAAILTAAGRCERARPDDLTAHIDTAITATREDR